MLSSAVVAMLPTPKASDGRRGDCPGERRRRSPSLAAVPGLLPTPMASDGTGGGTHPDRRRGHTSQLVDYALLADSAQWGVYGAAIRRQEQLSRPAPAPTEPNTQGNPRLSPRFSEWMMWWPPGLVTDPALGLSRRDQLRLIGNGVVTAQAVCAYRYLLGHACDQWRRPPLQDACLVCRFA